MTQLGRFLASIVDTVIDAALVDNTPRLLDILNGLNTEKLRKVLTRTDERGYTPLHLAAERNQPESLKCLLIKEANPNIRSSLSSSEVTPLHVAALHGHLACLQLLVQLGGDIMVQDRRQLTPVDYAQINGQDFCFNYLNEVIAKRQAEERTGVEDVLIQLEKNLAIDNVQTLNHWKQFNDLFPLSITTHDPSQLESIMYRHCILINNRNMVRVLVRISKDIPISLHCSSLLHAACRYGCLDLTRLLISKMPEIMFSITNEAYNPLHVAVVHQHVDIVKTLVQTQVSRTQCRTRQPSEPGSERENSFCESLHLNQAKFGEATMSGHTVLHFAVAVNNTDILHILLKHLRRLKLNSEGAKCGYTALHLAVFLNHSECAKLLLKAGANPNTCLCSTPTAEELSNISCTILSEAVINKNLKLLQSLIDFGGEDKGHCAIRLCIPSAEHRGFIEPLLGSLVRLDDGLKVNKQTTRKVKTGVAEWSGLQLTEVDPMWITRAILCCKFLKGQKIESGNLCDYLTTVNLSGNRLTCLPQQVFQLRGLQILNVSSNQIAGLPDLQETYNSEKNLYEWSCASLARLNLSKNDLTDLPHFLFAIPNLSHLDVSNNQLRSLPFALWTAPKLYQMIGSHNKLEALPSNWPGVLTMFHVYEPESSSDQPGSPLGGKPYHGRGVGKPKHKKHASLPRGTTSSFEHETEEPAISKLQDRLNISNSNLPIEWSTEEGREEVYDGLAILNLSNNLIQEVPDNFPCLCPKLVRLDLSHNQIRSISLPRQFPAHLKHLKLCNNQIEIVNSKENLAKPLPCTNPLVLNETEAIYHDKVTFCSHRQHSQLTRLGVLELSGCGLREVNLYSQTLAINQHRRKSRHEGTQETHQGTQIHTPSNRSQNPDGLVCPLLTRLLLPHNTLTRVPESICDMISLNSLDLSNNEIIELPARLGNLCNLWEFPLDGLNLISPPHNIIERGKTRDIIGFLWSLLQRARPYHRMKLMLVGKAARGKTTLLSRISERGQRGLQENWALVRMVGADKHKGNLSTVGIVVSDWTYYKKVQESQTSLRSITFMTWDFGGQEEYYATHQCFISRRSLYLAVWNVTHGQAGAEELKPWLLNIQARAPNSPVIVVGTHLDKLSMKPQKEECRRCLDFIARTYGTAESQREGFPHIMKNMLVSCKNGRGISELRDAVFDVASQVKENTVAGRGIGCGRIPDYRLLMDQLVPASYLQLEDTVRNLAMHMRNVNKPPVLSYKELRELVFADSRTLISRHSADRELEQAVRFLHDNGTLLHYDDPLLADFYFVDPQWLCDMLAHIITVREINPFVREGVMRIADFPLIFNDDEFPMRWKREYIRLLTTFEVAVELRDGELLIPSVLPCEKPNLPCPAFPQSVRMLPSLRHTYIIPFVPSGFWPRLMSRLLSDKSIKQLARDGCNITEDDMGQLSWVKWRQGLILQYGNLTLVTIEELKHGLFPNDLQRRGIKFFHDGRWEPINRRDIKICGISVTVPDLYPILKYLERAQNSRRALSTTSEPCPCPPAEVGHHGNKQRSQPLPPVPEVSIAGSYSQLHHQSAESHDAQPGSGDDGVSCANRVVEMDKIDEEFQKLAMKCKDRCRLLSCDVAVSPRAAVSSPFNNWPVPSEDGLPLSADGKSQLESRLNSFDMRLRAPSSDISSRPSSRTVSRSSQGSGEATPPKREPLTVDEDKHDQMRAGLISKAVDHITLLVEDWFTGVRPRFHLVPCPHCASSGNQGNSELPHQTQLVRSFSSDTSLHVGTNEGEGAPSGATPTCNEKENSLSPGATQPSSLQKGGLQDLSDSHKSSPPTPHVVSPITVSPATPSQKPLSFSSRFSKSSWRHRKKAGSGPPQTGSPGSMYRAAGGGRYLEPELDHNGVMDPYNYAFRYDDCVVTARNQDYMTCPAHGKILLRYMAPDTLFLAQGTDILISSGDCLKESVLGQGAYATVFKVKVKRQGEADYRGPYALKALTKEWTQQSSFPSTPPSPSASSTPRQPTPHRPPTRYSILIGFSNLKKELSILYPLQNRHVVRLHGVVLRPLGLILELAPGGSLKKTLERYHDVQQHLPANVTQSVIIQVALAIQYLHDCSIIYRDLKSDNVLVWQFPEPHDSGLIPRGRLGMETVLLKLSDYGISQFAATQGARGLVGTPGFMAPEILKYHGKEVYTDQVDIFSFGMFMYELVTLHIPYDTLTAQQANQANESGVRPALTRKDLQCTVLLRELMVWCWQQNPDDRPTAEAIIATAETEQFLRLLNGIRISCGGQVTAACVAVSPTSTYLNHSTMSHHYGNRPTPSPRPPPIHTNLTNPFVFDRNSSGPLQTSTLKSTAASEIKDVAPSVLTNGKLHQDESGVDQSSLRLSQNELAGDQLGDKGSVAVNLTESHDATVAPTDTGDALQHNDQQNRISSNTADTGFSSKRATTEMQTDSPELQRRRVINTEDSSCSTGGSTNKSTTDSGFFPSVIPESWTERQPRVRAGDSDEVTVKPSSQPSSQGQNAVPGSRPPPLSPYRRRASSSSTPRPVSAPTLEIIPPYMTDSRQRAVHYGRRDAMSKVKEQRSLSSDGTILTTTQPLILPPPDQPSSQRSQQRSPAGPKLSRFSEPRTRWNYSPRHRWSVGEFDSTFYSPSSDSIFRFTEEEPSFEVWVASCDAHRSVVSVIGYNGLFTNLEEIDVGDSPVLSICSVGRQMWVGFEIGCILIFNSANHHLVAHTWIKQYTAIISILHIPELKRVYVTLATGSVFAFQDEVAPLPGNEVAQVSLQLVSEYHDPGREANCVIAVPTASESGSGMSHELWVGQCNAMITVLDPRDLSVVKFIQNTRDMSPTPNYMAYLTYTSLVCGESKMRTGDSADSQAVPVVTMDTDTQLHQKPSLSVYGALYHGQYVTQWDASSKELVACHNCQKCMEEKEECRISSLHYHSLQLLVGLCTGRILVLDALSFQHLSSLSCHRGAIHSLHALSLASLQPGSEPYAHSHSSEHWNTSSSSKRKDLQTSLPDRPSLGSISLSGSQPNSNDPSPIPLSYSDMEQRRSSEQSVSTSLSSSSQTGTGTRLLSFGSGFRSYYDGPESKLHLTSGFMLVWDLHRHTDEES